MRLRETGVTGTILAAKAGNGVDVDRILASFDFGPPESGNDGWFISAQRPDVDAATGHFGDLISALGGPAIVVRVLRDDWAYLIASAPGSESIAMVMTPNALRAEVGLPGLANGSAPKAKGGRRREPRSGDHERRRRRGRR